MFAVPAAHRRYLKVETTIAVAINAVISALFAWGLFRGAAAVPLWGAAGIGLDLVPTVFMITLMMTIALTLITRKRMRAGAIDPLRGIDAPAWLAWLPHNVLLRALALALPLTAILVPASVSVLAAAGASSMGFATFVGFKILYGAAVGALVTPIIVLRVLHEPPAVS